MITLKRATPEAVRYACLKFHYAKAVPSVQYAYNVYNEQSEWCGCIVFSPGATPNIASAVNAKKGEVCELVRVALNGKQPHTSECVAKALKQLHKDAPQIKIVVSFADPEQGHVGVIYQATNWIYVGTTADHSHSNKATAFIVFGKRMHPKSVYARGWKQSINWLRENIDPNAYEMHERPKWKYIFCFDKKLRKEWGKQARPYPKAVKQ